MDRTSALADLQAAQVQLRQAEAGIAEASQKLQGWCSGRIRDPPNTVMGTAWGSLVPDRDQLSQEMQFGTPGSAWGAIGSTAPVMPQSVPWSTPEWNTWWQAFANHLAGWVTTRTEHNVTTALAHSSPVHNGMIDDLTVVTHELNELHHNTRRFHTHMIDLTSQTNRVVDQRQQSLD